MAATVTQKGQVTIPKRVRDALGIVPGSKVEFTRTADGQIIMMKAGQASARSVLAGLRGSAGPGMTTDEIMAMTRGDPSE
ncbi:MAG: AbrB/MazE/SpoVT family DNA-binding domain-containing protein [Phreatobacter sp.]|nr:AbrB/MazE/SpoVT family DNA-binding domain-containing protein [Phreatobacter sp.]